MRVVEVFSGLALGGVERSLQDRLISVSSNVQTSVISTGSISLEFLHSLRDSGVSPSQVATPTRRALISEIRHLSPDVVLLHTPREALRLLRIRLPSGFPPVVVIAHSERVSGRQASAPAVSAALRLVNPRASLHVAVSNRVANSAWCAGARRIEVCHLGSQLRTGGAEAAPTWPGNGPIRVLALSRLVAYKGLAPLLTSLSGVAQTWRERGVSLVIVGDGPEMQRLLTLVHDFRLEDIVQVRGPTSSPGTWMKASDWLVIPSLFEGGPLTAYEAMLAGTRIASTRVGVVPELLEGDDYSLMVPDATAPNLRRLLLGIAAAGPCGHGEREVRAHRSTQWTTPNCSAQLYSILKQVADEHSARGRKL